MSGCARLSNATDRAHSPVLNSLASADLAAGGGRGKCTRGKRGDVSPRENVEEKGRREGRGEKGGEKKKREIDTHLRFARPWPRVNVAATQDAVATRGARMHINRGDIICLIRANERKGKRRWVTRSAFRRRPTNAVIRN